MFYCTIFTFTSHKGSFILSVQFESTYVITEFSKTYNIIMFETVKLNYFCLDLLNLVLYSCTSSHTYMLNQSLDFRNNTFVKLTFDMDRKILLTLIESKTCTCNF